MADLDPGLVGFIAGAAPWMVEEVQGAQEARAAGQRANEARAADAALQREFAQQGIRWKVEDAKAAGIHPLAALGAQTHSYSGNFAADTGGYSKANMYGRMSDMGQNLGRALAATRTDDERTRAFQDEQIRGQQLDNQGKELNNALLASQLSSRNSGQVGPGMPKELNTNPDVGWSRTDQGLVPVPGKDVKERIEDNFFHEAAHFYRNNVLPNFGLSEPPPKNLLPKGKDTWKWSYKDQQWYPSNLPEWLQDRKNY